MQVSEATRCLEAHLNVHWLRPESALWDAIASAVVSEVPLASPSLDLGAGNGLFSFITAGGEFAPEYDWYHNADPHGFWEGSDIYDTFVSGPRPEWIIRRPRYQMDCAVDCKPNLLRQADALDFYRETVLADANQRLPFADGVFATVFSNILCWLEPAEAALREIRRLLRPGGRALLCLPDPRFFEWCVSYRWRERDSDLLKLLNRGRSNIIQWVLPYPEFRRLAETVGFSVAWHTTYLSQLTLKVWDIGLRPLSPVLIKMTRALKETDRLSLKAEWISSLRPFLTELFEMDRSSPEPGGYRCICLEKT